MKREFKAGQRVLVRNNDLQEWEAGVLIKKYNDRSHPFYVCLDKSGKTFMWSQCRHIDDFRNGEKVQVRDRDDQEWMDCTYACYIDNVIGRTNVHYVFVPGIGHVGNYNQCRWHPSMPWADKEEPLTLKQRIEALERKLKNL